AVGAAWEHGRDRSRAGSGIDVPALVPVRGGGGRESEEGRCDRVFGIDGPVQCAAPALDVVCLQRSVESAGMGEGPGVFGGGRQGASKAGKVRASRSGRDVPQSAPSRSSDKSRFCAGRLPLQLTARCRRYKLRILGMGRKAQKNDSLPGSLDMLILRTLSLRDLHGYGIVQFIQQSSDNELLIEEGSLYPALQRLELNGWIEGVWGVTSNNRRARIYKITGAGRKQLAVETRKYAKLT